MRRLVALAVLILASVARAAGAPPPSCPAGTDWTRTATDSVGQTTYRITGPCFVTFPANFVVTVSVTDTAHPSAWVGSRWSVVDTRIDAGSVSTTIASGSSVDTDPSGGWVTTCSDRYTVAPPVNHRIEFHFTDLGDGAGAHGWSASLVGTVTYDPYPSPPPEAAPTEGAPAAAPPEAGGCGSSGVAPALLGLAALAAAAWPRRRRAR